MNKRAFGAVAALCLLAGCVTTTSDTSTVTTWRGWNVAGMLPPLELVAVANRLQTEGRIVFRYVDPQTVATNCRAQPQDVQGCTVERGLNYVVFVDAGLPDWMQELVATHEGGHGAQLSLGRVPDHAGYVDPTVDLIRRLGG